MGYAVLCTKLFWWLWKSFLTIHLISGELTPELERQQQQYEDWLMKHGNYLEMQVKTLEQQIGKCKRTKKAINARNRQVRVGFLFLWIKVEGINIKI